MLAALKRSANGSEYGGFAHRNAIGVGAAGIAVLVAVAAHDGTEFARAKGGLELAAAAAVIGAAYARRCAEAAGEVAELIGRALNAAARAANAGGWHRRGRRALALMRDRGACCTRLTAIAVRLAVAAAYGQVDHRTHDVGADRLAGTGLVRGAAHCVVRVHTGLTCSALKAKQAAAMANGRGRHLRLERERVRVARAATAGATEAKAHFVRAACSQLAQRPTEGHLAGAAWPRAACLCHGRLSDRARDGDDFPFVASARVLRKRDDHVVADRGVKRAPVVRCRQTNFIARAA